MTNALRSLAVTLALGAMLLRALLPAGWMPAPDGSSLVICTNDGPLRLSPAHIPLHKGQQDHNSVCPFAAAAHLAAPGAAQAIQLPLAIATGDRVFVVHGAPAVRPSATQAPRGPPLSV